MTSTKRSDIEILKSICHIQRDNTDPNFRKEFFEVYLVDNTVYWINITDGVVSGTPPSLSVDQFLEPCSNKVNPETIKTVCKCDDVNGDLSTIVPFVKAYIQCTSNGSIISNFIGDFEDDTFQVDYTPTNEVSCSDIGTQGLIRLLTYCDSGVTFYRLIDVYSGTILGQYDKDFNSYTTVGTVTIGTCASTLIKEEHTITNGTGSVPAGLKSVFMKSQAVGSTVNGFPLELGETISFNATENVGRTGTLPAIVVVGTVAWIGLSVIE